MQIVLETECQQQKQYFDQAKGIIKRQSSFIIIDDDLK